MEKKEKTPKYGALVVNLGTGLSQVIKEDSEEKRQKAIDVSRLAGYGCLNRWKE